MPNLLGQTEAPKSAETAVAETEPTPTEPTAPVEPSLPVNPVEAEGGAGLPDPPPVGELFPENAQEEGLPADFSQSVTMNLVRALVEEGVLKREKAAALLLQAEKEALAARKSEKERQTAAKEEEDEAMRVSYVPEAVRSQLKAEVRNEVIAELKSGGSLSLLHVPQIESENKFGGDLRLRYEYISFPQGNDNTGAFPNFNAINTGAPFDTAGVVFSPQHNVDQDRQRFRTRVRLGADFHLEDDWLVGIRVATGNDNSPTSTNQTIGGAGSGQGGNFSRYAIWLDRAFAQYKKDGKAGVITLRAGRFDNPFQSTPIIYDEDLGFDGAALTIKANATSFFKPWVTGGAFPIFNTDLNFATNSPTKFESIDRYLYGGQVGFDLKLGKRASATFSGAYYDFRNVEGQLSTPYLPLSAQDAGDTDHTRPSFAQRGNTYRPLRSIIPDPLNNFGTSNQFQYFGLATPFRPLSFNGKLDIQVLEPVVLTLFGEYIKNTAFDSQLLEEVAVNNRGPLTVDPETGKVAPTGLAAYEGENTAWIVGAKFGHAVLNQRGAWQLGVDYRWVGSDAVVDGFTESEFGGGGTNVKGISFIGRIALTKDVSLALQWMSSDQISGPPMKRDNVAVDFQVKF